LLIRSWIDEKILVYVLKMWRTLHNIDIIQNPGPHNNSYHRLPPE